MQGELLQHRLPPYGYCGTVFRLTPDGTLTTLYNFQGSLTDGSLPSAALVQGIDGNFYGTTSTGGPGNDGTAFRLSDPSPVQFVAVTPCRVVDTRNPNGTFGGPPIQGGSYRSFPLPLGGCDIPATAAGYSLNVTVVPNGPLGYLTIWPTAWSQPYVSTMNSRDGRIKANAAIVPAGVNDAVSVYVTDTTNVVLDIDGYFAPASGITLTFYPLPPCRIADTRDPSYPQGLGRPSLSAQLPRNFPILEATNCCPAGVNPAAYSFSFTAVPHGRLGYLTVWPYGQSQPYVSTLNAPTGAVTANAAIVPAGMNGEISTFAYNDTDLVVDVNGYFAAQAQGGLSLYATVPCRVLDTRNGNGAFSGTLSPPVDVLGTPCGVSPQSLAYVFNATVVPAGSLGYLTLWPDGGQQPLVSTLNAYDGAITSNMAIVPAGNQGKVDAYAGHGVTQLILDISSYFCAVALSLNRVLSLTRSGVQLLGRANRRRRARRLRRMRPLRHLSKQLRATDTATKYKHHNKQVKRANTTSTTLSSDRILRFRLFRYRLWLRRKGVRCFSQSRERRCGSGTRHTVVC